MSKHKSLEVINGELLVFGEKLPRHPEFPWLFSATHLHKFCGPTLRKIAEREGKDPDKVFAARRPGEWLKKNILASSQTERVAAFAKYTRRRSRKYGPNLGFRDSGNLDATLVASTIRGPAVSQAQKGIYPSASVQKHRKTASVGVENRVHVG